MTNNKDYGFTLIELLAVIVILAIILAIAIPGISGIIKNSTKSSFASDAKMVLKAIEYKKLETETYDPLTLTKENMTTDLKISSDNYEQISLSLVGKEIRVVIVGAGKWQGLTAYGTFKKMTVVNSEDYDVTPPVITVTGANPATIYIGDAYTEAGATANDLKDGNITANIATTGSVNTGTLGTYTITYTVSDAMGNEAVATRTVNVTKAGNPPVLATGMTPIKWNGSTWVNTTADDVAWYNYTTTDKQWANAKTADGSFWVWIPRYIYKIPTANWHTTTAGTINIQFSIGTDDTSGGTVTLDTGTTANASNNKWTNHPAFTFGTTELAGIWVAKFEPSSNGGVVKIVPGATPWGSLTIGTAFTNCRNMETNSVYGWGTTGTGVDTHMAKNTEWGAITYLSHSAYGKNAEVTANYNSYNYTGGEAGTSYISKTAQSTTGNVHGIYDMAGNVYEYVAAYMNNGNANLATYGSSIVSADGKYKDLYTPGATDNLPNNNANAVNKKGDAVWETSSTGEVNYQSWYGDTSVIPAAGSTWFERGGYQSSGGAFDYASQNGSAGSAMSFRPILAVEAGL